jgi:hypothetical protein
MFSLLSLEDGNRSSFRNVVFLLPGTAYDGKNSKIPVILCAIHHRQNPLNVIISSGVDAVMRFTQCFVRTLNGKCCTQEIYEQVFI